MLHIYIYFTVCWYKCIVRVLFVWFAYMFGIAVALLYMQFFWTGAFLVQSCFLLSPSIVVLAGTRQNAALANCDALCFSRIIESRNRRQIVSNLCKQWLVQRGRARGAMTLKLMTNTTRDDEYCMPMTPPVQWRFRHMLFYRDLELWPFDPKI